MAQIEMIARFNLIIKKLRKQPATFVEISAYLDFESNLQGYDFNISKRTFDRDRNTISSLFNIDIVWDSRRQVYYLEMDGQPEASERILEAFDVFNALNIADRLSEYIHFESRKSAGTENLYDLLHAIENRCLIRFRYQKYWEDKPELKTVESYALKEFKNRWYLLGKDEKKQNLRIYALDRLNELTILNTKFVYPAGFAVKSYFSNCFGIITSEGQSPVEVILSFNVWQGKYIKSLPLHHSQQILVDSSKEFRIKLLLVVTFDLVMEILSYGPDVKVIEPPSLQDEIKLRLAESLSNYS